MNDIFLNGKKIGHYYHIVHYNGLLETYELFLFSEGTCPAYEFDNYESLCDFLDNIYGEDWYEE